MKKQDISAGSQQPALQPTKPDGQMARNSDASQPPSTLPATLTNTGGHKRDCSAGTAACDPPKNANVASTRRRTASATYVSPTPQHRHQAQQIEQDLHAVLEWHRRAAQRTATTKSPATVVAPKPPQHATLNLRNGEGEELQDCQNIATSVAESLYDNANDTRAPVEVQSENRHDDPVLDYLSAAENGIPPHAPLSPRLIPASSKLVHSQPIVQMIPHSLIQQYISHVEMKYELAHRALSQPAAGPAIKHRVPAVNYMPPVTRAQPLPLPTVHGPPSCGEYPPLETWEDIRNEMRALSSAFGVPSSGAAQ
ncbi:hypothetical protein BC835DRAFT_1415898 [Cytidiella melzeri]|nr:hypothetical protein BC835DRAFT_1415898 [Cytidiella melzeri]